MAINTKATQDWEAKSKPFLRWAGSKRKLLTRLAPYWNSGNYDRYIEPFMGSACLFFALSPKRAHLNDINPIIESTFKAIKKSPARVYKKAASYPVSKEFYLKLRPKAFEEGNDVKKAANFLYLNRNCFNGIFRTNKLGQFNVPFSSSRTGKIPEWKDFAATAETLQRATLHCEDFEKFLNKTVRRGDFVYLDPPYAVGNRRIFRQYSPDSFGLDDITRLSKILREIDRRGAHFVLSYADCQEARASFSKWHVRKLYTTRNISGFEYGRRKAAELIITNIRGN